MAAKLASTHDYTQDSDTDASDYDFDLTAEEEDLLESLVATASSKRPASSTSGQSSGTQIATSGSSLRSDIVAAFATHASVKSLHDSEIDFNVRQVYKDRGLTYRDDSTVLSSVAAYGALESVDEGDGDEITAVVEEAERRIPQPVQVGDVRYPDCECPHRSLDQKYRSD